MSAVLGKYHGVVLRGVGAVMFVHRHHCRCGYFADAVVDRAAHQEYLRATRHLLFPRSDLVGSPITFGHLQFGARRVEESVQCLREGVDQLVRGSVAPTDDSIAGAGAVCGGRAEVLNLVGQPKQHTVAVERSQEMLGCASDERRHSDSSHAEPGDVDFGEFGKRSSYPSSLRVGCHVHPKLCEIRFRRVASRLGDTEDLVRSTVACDPAPYIGRIVLGLDHFHQRRRCRRSSGQVTLAFGEDLTPLVKNRCCRSGRYELGYDYAAHPCDDTELPTPSWNHANPNPVGLRRQLPAFRHV